MTPPEPPMDPPGPNGPGDPVEPVGPPTEPIPPVPPTEPVPPLPPTEAVPVVPPTQPMPIVDPNEAVPPGRDPRWYENRGAVAAIIAIGLIGIFLLIAWLVWWSDDDDSDDATIDSALIVDSSTLPDATTIPTGSIVTVTPAPTIEVTLPPETTAPPTTIPDTTRSSDDGSSDDGGTDHHRGRDDDHGAHHRSRPRPTISDALANDPDLSRLAELVEVADLMDALATTDPLTLFAPDNAAFEAFEAANPDVDLDDPATVSDLLLGHAIEDRVDIATLTDPTDLGTIFGSTLTVDDSLVTAIDGTDLPDPVPTLTPSDAEVSNGFLYIIDQVLVAS